MEIIFFSFFSLFGKMIENSTKRMDVRFEYSRDMALKHHTDPRFKSTMSIDEDLSLSFLHKKRVRMNQLWAVGMAILGKEKRDFLSLCM